MVAARFGRDSRRRRLGALWLCVIGLLGVFAIGYPGYFVFDAIWPGYYYSPVAAGKNAWLLGQALFIAIYFAGILLDVRRGPARSQCHPGKPHRCTANREDIMIDKQRSRRLTAATCCSAPLRWPPLRPSAPMARSLRARKASVAQPAATATVAGVGARSAARAGHAA